MPPGKVLGTPKHTENTKPHEVFGCIGLFFLTIIPENWKWTHFDKDIFIQLSFFVPKCVIDFFSSNLCTAKIFRPVGFFLGSSVFVKTPPRSALGRAHENRCRRGRRWAQSYARAVGGFGVPKTPVVLGVGRMMGVFRIFLVGFGMSSECRGKFWTNNHVTDIDCGVESLVVHQFSAIRLAVRSSFGSAKNHHPFWDSLTSTR